MDEALVQFREAADRENVERPLRRRYSPTLQREAVAYWQQRRGQEGTRPVAVALGVSLTTLQRWTRGAARRAGFRAVAIVERPAAGDSRARRDPDDGRRPARRGADRGDGGAPAHTAAMRWHGRRVAVYAYAQPVDMRKGFDGLSALVTGPLARDPLTGDVFLFVGRDRGRAKVLHWDGTGLCVYAKGSNAGALRGSGTTRMARNP